MTPHDVAIALYNLTLIPVIFMSVLYLTLSLVALAIRQKQDFGARQHDPFVSIQIPTYNDPIAERCVRSCLEMDYPKDKFEIIIADDSTHVETRRKLEAFAGQHPKMVKYLHRNNRHGYKAGALQEAMKATKGEILVVFDSDWIPQRDFLKKALIPFADPKVAIVQTRQGFYNKDRNFVTRFAAYILLAYHTIFMPINNKLNTVFFCGTAGAIRRSAFEEAGGWNLRSLTEDSDITVRILAKGYKSVYLDFETPSEVPETLESFVKQQMRWCYGNTRVFLDNAPQILYKPGLKLRQRLMITFITLGNITAPVVMLMTVFGFLGWFLGEPTLMNLSNIMDFLAKFLITAGFLGVGFVTLYMRDMLREFPQMAASLLSMGMVLAVGNTFAFYKAVMNRKLHWWCTPKIENDRV